MNVLKYRVSLDMFDTLSQITIKAKKGDSACQIHITLTEKGKIYHIGEGCYATFNAKKSDGNFVYDKCTIENNTIVYDFSSSIDDNGICQVSAHEGIVECEVTLYNAEGKQLTSPRFVLFIDGTVYNGEEITSTPEANVLKELINETNNLIDDVETKLENGEFKGEKGEKGENGKDAVTDQTYNPESENAQSGKAVNSAILQHDTSNISHTDIRREILSIKSSLSAKITREIYDELPDVAYGKENIIYMVPNTEAKENNVYNEYMLVSNNSNSITQYNSVSAGLVTYVGTGNVVQNTDIKNAVCVAIIPHLGGAQYHFTGKTTDEESITIQFTLNDDNSFSEVDFNNSVIDFFVGPSPLYFDAVVYNTNTQRHYELIGSTAVDLSGYATTEYVDNIENHNKSYVNQTFANALKGSKSGSAVIIDDASLTEHEVDVKVQSKNILNCKAGFYNGFPSDVADTFAWTVTDNGVLIDIKKDISGRAYNVGFRIGNAKELSGKTLTLSAEYIPTTNVPITGEPFAFFSFTNLTGGYWGSSGSHVQIPGTQKNEDGSWTITIPEKVTHQYVACVLYLGCDETFTAGDIVEWKNVQVEIGSTASGYVPHDINLNTVEVVKRGANLNNYFSPLSKNGFVCTPIDNGSGIVINGLSTQTSTETLLFKKDTMPYGTYNITVIFENVPEGFTGESYVAFMPSWALTIFAKNGLVQTVKFTGTFDTLRVGISEADIHCNFEDFTIKVLISPTTDGDITDYVPYVNTQTFTVNADGAINGVTPLQPITVLTPNTNAVTITADYNRDINKAFAKLEQAILNNI